MEAAAGAQTYQGFSALAELTAWVQGFAQVELDRSPARRTTCKEGEGGGAGSIEEKCARKTT